VSPSIDRKTKYILAVLFIALPFPLMLLFSNPKLGATTLLMLVIPVVVLLIYRHSDASSSDKRPSSDD
jgi:hypothetical protein